MCSFGKSRPEMLSIEVFFKKSNGAACGARKKIQKTIDFGVIVRPLVHAFVIALFFIFRSLCKSMCATCVGVVFGCMKTDEEIV